MKPAAPNVPVPQVAASAASTTSSAATLTTPATKPPEAKLEVPAENAVAPQTYNLPPECGAVKLAANNSVIICKSVPESLTDKFFVAAPSIGVSLVALALSCVALYYNVRKDSRVRDQSIKDDYWLRKIVSPASIEPFVTLSTEIISDLPEAAAGVTDAEVKAWYDQRHTSLLRLKPKFKTLELLDVDLFRDVEVELQSFEDELATYIGAVRSYLNTAKNAPVRAVTISKLSTSQLSLLRHIQSHQTTLGNDK